MPAPSQQQFYDYDLFDGDLWDEVKFDQDIYDAAVATSEHSL